MSMLYFEFWQVPSCLNNLLMLLLITTGAFFVFVGNCESGKKKAFKLLLSDAQIEQCEENSSF